MPNKGFRWKKLSPEEYEVRNSLICRDYMAGQTQKEIAKTYSMSPQTVSVRIRKEKRRGNIEVPE